MSAPLTPRDSEDQGLKCDEPSLRESMRHAPGPWSACKGGGCSCGFIWDATGEIHVASVHDSSALGQNWYGSDAAVHPPTRAANARLIACAPDLLDALRAAEQQLDYGQIDTAIAVIRAVIAKATGGKAEGVSQ